MANREMNFRIKAVDQFWEAYWDKVSPELGLVNMDHPRNCN